MEGTILLLKKKRRVTTTTKYNVKRNPIKELQKSSENFQGSERGRNTKML